MMPAQPPGVPIIMRFGTRSTLHLVALGAATASLAAALLLGSSDESVAAEARTKVILNGKSVAVHFNDGDSFRLLDGDFEGSKARLSGFNTLESYGPVHQWGDWTAKELYVLAKMGTLNGRRGVWHCETDGKTDTYGRILVWCPDLAEDQVRKGLAHVLSIDDAPGNDALIDAQNEAIAARRGIWAHGVPEFVLTSLHSEEEDVEGHGTYNRLVSSVDGHSIKWKHEARYSECDKVCAMVYPVDALVLDGLVESAKLDPKLGPLLEGLSDAEVRKVLHDYAKFRNVDREVPEDRREACNTELSKWAEAGKFGGTEGRESACMIHVAFDRRFGGNKAKCLK
jgi:micrococcal nuclease